MACGIFATCSQRHTKQARPIALLLHCALGFLLLTLSLPTAYAWALTSTHTNYRRLIHGLPTRKGSVEPEANIQPDPYTTKWPNTIAICALMKDEHPEDVKEFIAYHRWVGVDTFYLRENGNDSMIEEHLQPYIDHGIVDFGLLVGPKHPTQTNWYNACSKEAQKTHSWVAFIDLDEFIVVLNKQKSVTERGALKNILKQSFRYTAAVSMQWVLFGSGGHKTRPAEGQLKGFNRCDGQFSKQMKCLGNAFWFHYRATFRPTHVHQCNFRFGAVSVLGNSEPLNMWRVIIPMSGSNRGPYAASNAGHLSPSEHKSFTNITDGYQIALFHFVTRSQSDFIERKINLRSGKYATQFAKVANAGAESEGQANLDKQYAAFEKEHGFDGTHDICNQGGLLHDAIEAARDQGWSELDVQ